MLALNLQHRVLKLQVLWSLITENTNPAIAPQRCLFLDMPARGRLWRQDPHLLLRPLRIKLLYIRFDDIKHERLFLKFKFFDL
jgi:hypothetical protein